MKSKEQLTNSSTITNTSNTNSSNINIRNNHPMDFPFDQYFTFLLMSVLCFVTMACAWISSSTSSNKSVGKEIYGESNSSANEKTRLLEKIDNSEKNYNIW